MPSSRSTQVPTTAAGAPARAESDQYPHQWRHLRSLHAFGPPLHQRNPLGHEESLPHVPPVDQAGGNKAAVVLLSAWGRNGTTRCAAERWVTSSRRRCSRLFVSSASHLGFPCQSTAGASVTVSTVRRFHLEPNRLPTKRLEAYHPVDSGQIQKRLVDGVDIHSRCQSFQWSSSSPAGLHAICGNRENHWNGVFEPPPP